MKRDITVLAALIAFAVGGCANSSQSEVHKLESERNQAEREYEPSAEVKEAQHEAHAIEEAEGAQRATEDEENRPALEAEVQQEIEEHERERQELRGH